jgi:hypothetical protein
MDDSRYLREARSLWQEQDKVDCVRLLDKLAKQHEEQEKPEKALAIYSFLRSHLQANAGRAVHRVREQQVLPDLGFLRKLFETFFPQTQVVSVNESLEFKPDEVFELLWDIDVLLYYDWQKIGRLLLQAAALCGERADLKGALARRAVEFLPTCRTAQSMFCAHAEDWNENSEEFYELALCYEYGPVRRALFGITASTLMEDGLFEQAAIYCLQESVVFEQHRPERLDLIENFSDSLKQMGNLRAWRLLRQARLEDFADHGWVNWCMGRLLGVRGLIPEALAQWRLALSQMRGKERFWVLLDIGRGHRDVDVLAEAAKIARGMECYRAGRWLRKIVLVCLALNSPQSLHLGFSCCEAACAEEEEWEDNNRLLAYSQELRGRVLLKQKDHFRAREAFLISRELYQDEKNMERVNRYLALTASLMGNNRACLQYSREAFLAAPSEQKDQRLGNIVDAHESLFNASAAANTYRLIAKGPYQLGRLAKLQYEAGRPDKAMEVLSRADQSSKAQVLFSLGELEQAQAFASGELREVIEAERAPMDCRQRLLEARREKAMVKLRRPLRRLLEERLGRDDLVLHPRNRHYEIRQLRIRPVALVSCSTSRSRARDRCQEFVNAVKDFHQREFGQWSAPPKVEELRIVEVGTEVFACRETTEWNTRVINLDKELGLRRRSRNEIVMVFHFPPKSNCGFRGVACYNTGFAHIWVSDSRFVDKVTVHEFYHASLRLEHSHGGPAPNDSWCLMTQGPRPLTTRYLQPFQKAICLTPRAVQWRIHKGLRAESEFRWAKAIEYYGEAFRKDPLHQWLAQKLSYLLYRENRCLEACEVIQRHATYYPNQESKSSLIDALAFNGFVAAARKVEKHFPRTGDTSSDIRYLVRAWKGAGNFRRALKLAQDNLSSACYCVDLLSDVAELQWLLKRRSAAEATFLEVLQRGRKDVLTPLCQIASERGAPGRARAYLEQGLEHDISERSASWLRMQFALREGDWDAVLEQLSQCTPWLGETGWYKSVDAILGHLQGRPARRSWGELERQGSGLQLVWLARVWVSIIDGTPDRRLLKQGYRLWPNDFRWNLARYLVDSTKVPKTYFHPSLV